MKEEEKLCCSHKTKERSEKEYKDLIHRLNRILKTGGCPHEKPVIQRNRHALLAPVIQDKFEHHAPEGPDGSFHKGLQSSILPTGNADKVLLVV